MKNLLSDSRRLLAIVLTATATLTAPAQDIWTNQTRLKAHPFDMKEVRLKKKSIFYKRFDLNRQYLRAFPVEPLLYNFRLNAGMKPKTRHLEGWENPTCELRGHFTGHFLSALSLEYSATGDNVFKLKADTLVAGLAAVQRRLGKTGYLSAFPETFFDRLENGQQVWAPYYTIHKILAGLIDCYRYLDNRQALDVARRLGTWVYNRNRHFSHAQMQRILNTEFGGIGESLWQLYDLTGDTTYASAARLFVHDRVLRPLYNHRDSLKGLHVNTQLPKLLAQARSYEENGNWRDRDMVCYAWHQIAGHRSYATGGCSNYEYFRSDPDQLADFTGPNDHENCVTHNMLKLTEHLFCWEPRVEYADYYENALINGILGTQHPKVGGTAQYYVSQRPGQFRAFCDPDSAFVCCSGTGIESFAKLNDNIYFHDDTTLWVNQYIPSTLDWRERGIGLDLETGYPRFDDIHLRLSLHHPERLSLKLRIPYWAQQGATVQVNGQPLDVVGEAASYLTLRREWHDGDRIDLVIPRSFHTWAMPDNPRRVAILYGPVVMTQALGTEGMSKAAQWGYGGNTEQQHLWGPVVDVPAIVTDSDNWLNAFKLHVPHRMTFDAKGISEPDSMLTLTPFYDLWGQRYTIYFDRYTRQEWRDFVSRYRTFPEGIADSVDFSDSISAYDHNFQVYDLLTGSTQGQRYVQSRSDMRFDLRLPKDVRQPVLRVTYYGDEHDASFHLLIDGQPLPDQPLTAHNGFFTVDYNLPEALVAGKKRICVGYTVERTNTLAVGATTTERHYRAVTPKVYGAQIKCR